MIEIVYASAATRMFTPSDLTAMLQGARRNNGRLGVSGILLYEDGCFLQVIEGDEHTVRSLFARIVEDDRHSRVSVLRERPIESRSFEQWTMGFVSLDANLRRALPESHSLRSNGTLTDLSSGMAGLLDEFRAGQHRHYILG